MEIGLGRKIGGSTVQTYYTGVRYRAFNTDGLYHSGLSMTDKTFKRWYDISKMNSRTNLVFIISLHYHFN